MLSIYLSTGIASTFILLRIYYFSDNESFFEDAMKQGFFYISEVRCIVIGPPGVGKTCFKYILFSRTPPSIRSSTPCAARPVRVIRIGKCGEEWVEVNDEHLEEMVAKSVPIFTTIIADEDMSDDLFRSLEQFSDSRKSTLKNKKVSQPSTNGSSTVAASECATLHEEKSKEMPNMSHNAGTPLNVSFFDKILHFIRSKHTRQSPSPTTSSPSKDPSDAVNDFSQQSPSPTTSIPSKDPLDDVIDNIFHHMSSPKDAAAFLDTEWILYTDSGGQPAFHDLYPVFLKGSTVAVFVHSLLNCLDENPLSEFYKGGKRIGPSEKTTQTNFEILQCLAQTMVSQRKGKDLSKFICVGTHRDKMRRCRESLEIKNKRLYDLLHPLFGDKLVLNGDSGSLQPLFILNTKKPKLPDREIAQQLRKAIESSAVVNRPIPMWWYVLEIILRKLATQLGRKILSWKECLKVAHSLNFTEGALRAAISYLHDLNIFLHYPAVLPDVVFSDPQVPLDILTELVALSYKLAGAKCEKSTTGLSLGPVTDQWIRFRDEGIVTPDIIESNEFKPHFSSDVLSSHGFLKLLQKVLVASPIPGNMFFIPAVLKCIAKPQLLHFRREAFTSAFVSFSKGCIPAGLVCCMVTDLQIEHKWELYQKDGRAACVARNCMQFHYPGTPCIVTLIDSFWHIEVHVSGPPAACLECCLSIKDDVFASIEAACNILDYDDLGPTLQFPCQAPHCHKDLHSAALSSNRKWVLCTIDNAVSAPITEEQKCWFNKSKYIHSNITFIFIYISIGIHYSGSTLPLLEPKVQDLMTGVASVITAKWQEMGILLGLEQNDLDTIQLSSNVPKTCFQQVFACWKQKQCSKYSWTTIYTALTSMNEQRLARAIKEKYLP